MISAMAVPSFMASLSLARPVAPADWGREDQEISER